MRGSGIAPSLDLALDNSRADDTRLRRTFFFAVRDVVFLSSSSISSGLDDEEVTDAAVWTLLNLAVVCSLLSDMTLTLGANLDISLLSDGGGGYVFDVLPPSCSCMGLLGWEVPGVEKKAPCLPLISRAAIPDFPPSFAASVSDFEVLEVASALSLEVLGCDWDIRRFRMRPRMGGNFVISSEASDSSMGIRVFEGSGVS